MEASHTDKDHDAILRYHIHLHTAGLKYCDANKYGHMFLR